MIKIDQYTFRNLTQEIDNGIKAMISKLETMLEQYGSFDFSQRLEEISKSYNLMLQYYSKGQLDPQRDKVYRDIRSQLTTLVQDMNMAWLISNNVSMKEAWTRSSGLNLTIDTIREQLENFVADQAMLTLEPETSREEKKRNLFRSHLDLINAIFCHILTSRQWTSSEVEQYTAVVLSPTVDSNDARILVSAISLSNWMVADINKVRSLMNIYRAASDEGVKQRALAGWALGIRAAGDIPAWEDLTEKMVKDICNDESTRTDLLNMQVQIIYTMNAEKDKDEIQKDIMPDIIRNTNIHMNKFGVVEEKEDDPLQDILHPEAQDEAMEQVERSMRKMADMEKKGSDIYFGGFSQMKRYGFFYHIVNWFTPFYIEHPGLTHVVDKMGNMKFFEILKQNGPFCDSDKYSFALALSNVIDTLPANIRDMLGSDNLFGMGVSGIADFNSPEFIRRRYIQDLYRFFNLYSRKNDFQSPLYLFLGDKNFGCESMIENKNKLGWMMIRHKRYDLLKSFHENWKDESRDWLLQDIIAAVVNGEYNENKEKEVDMLLEELPSDGDVLQAAARYYRRYPIKDKALELYEKLSLMYPDSKNIMMNYCVLLMESGQVEKSMKYLYKLDYKYPDDANITRVLAWGLMQEHELEKAEMKYRSLIHGTSTIEEDWINSGYCSWIAGDNREAANRFVRAKLLGGLSHLDIHFFDDRQFLEENGITATDRALMTDIVDLMIEKGED